MTHVPVQVCATAGRFRDNRRGILTVEHEAGDMAALVIHQAGGFDIPPTTTRIVMAGAHLTACIDQLRAVADQLEQSVMAEDTGLEAVTA